MKVGIAEKLDYPIHLDIESTNHCQLKCVMCPRRFMEQGLIELRKILALRSV